MPFQQETPERDPLNFADFVVDEGDALRNVINVGLGGVVAGVAGEYVVNLNISYRNDHYAGTTPPSVPDFIKNVPSLVKDVGGPGAAEFLFGTLVGIAAGATCASIQALRLSLKATRELKSKLGGPGPS